jgi:endoglucanase
VRTNQLGFLPEARKVGVVRAEGLEPVPFEVIDARGRTLVSGQTEPRGADADSGDAVHWADFSGLKSEGRGYVLRVGDDESHPFDVRADVYRSLVRDALAYFYHNRSGTPIEARFVGKKYARAAGHLSDAHATCPAGRCPYSLDVSGGWYDAGDFGKYVVNGGIATWTLLSLWERTQHHGANAELFADGALAIPEAGNGKPDLLDEVAWELRFMLGMQVPQGQPLAGLVHHKVHDSSWGPLAVTPPSDAKFRFLRAPSTAATFNLAAVAAQCARVYASVDPSLAKRCRAAAGRAWNAAQRNPVLLASPQDNMGGGPYDDKDVSDERYWAAAELYLTFKKPEFLDVLRASPHHGRLSPRVGDAAGQHLAALNWQATAALGAISLITVPSDLPAEDREKLRQSVLQAADEYLKVIARQGYRMPLEPGSNRHYPWGSNSFVVNNALVLAVAHQLTGEKRYRDGAAEGLDYLLGRNPLGLSYVAGYGERAFEKPHHRFWAHGVAPARPRPPAGALAGGPNSKLEDPTAKRLLSGCAPAKCYADNAEAWSLNEVAINWNAPLAWVAAYLDDAARSTSRVGGRHPVAP